MSARRRCASAGPHRALESRGLTVVDVVADTDSVTWIEGVTREPSRQPDVPVWWLVAFALAVLAGVCAAVSLFLDVGFGIGGVYDGGWVLAFFVSFGAMLVLFVVSICIGLSALKRRRAVGGRNRLFLLAAILELAALAALEGADLLGMAGEGIVLYVNLIIVAFILGLIRWNIEIRRRLRFPFPQRTRAERLPTADR